MWKGVFLFRNICFLHMLTSSIKNGSTKCPESDFPLSLGTPKTTWFLEMVLQILFPYIWGNIYIYIFKEVCVKLAFLSTYLKVCLSCSLTPLTDGIRLLLCAIVLIQHVPFSIIIIPCMIVSMRNFSSSSCQVHGF